VVSVSWRFDTKLRWVSSEVEAVHKQLGQGVVRRLASEVSTGGEHRARDVTVLIVAVPDRVMIEPARVRFWASWSSDGRALTLASELSWSGCRSSRLTPLNSAFCTVEVI